MPGDDLIYIDLSKNSYPTHQHLIRQLVAFGYSRVRMVLEPGEFSVRGAIIDIFAANHSHPLRIEYDGDVIDRLNSFNLHSQRSVSNLEKTDVAPVDEAMGAAFYISSEGGTQLVSSFDHGDYVVHETFGMAIYKGLVRLKIRRQEAEYVWLQYKGEDKVYVPLDQLDLIHRYSGSEAKPKLNGLHDGSWQRAKKQAQKAIVELAQDIYFRNKLRQEKAGFAFSEDSIWQVELEESFAHTDTPDQAKATQQIKADMERSQPMDRLICGDVGYGKTEVLLRAAFKAAENQKQVAILVPTTLLARQHVQVFQDRFKPFPYRVAELSRFVDRRMQKRVVEQLKTHGIDVVIGTHRLLQKDVSFKDLGLVIIDEEQRFGVRHKERMKELKVNVDFLSVSATPIPRTLYMSLTGSKDLSTLETPPKKRKPVFTTVAPYSDTLVEKAVRHELKHQGQVYYLYNNVADIQQKYANLSRLFPDQRIAIAHGQMPEQELAKTIASFLNQEYDLLLCTTIIESGLDMPHVNTIVIESAERFGLSQIHQLRGRVGRSERQGYAYLLHKPVAQLSDIATKRLRAIKEYATLGSGYHLALRDLEIRGAGTLLGHRQSGHMTRVGFDLYCKLLQQATSGSGADKQDKRPVLDDRVVALIPGDYIASERERLALYQRLMRCVKADEVDGLREECLDRYGGMPQTVDLFFQSIRIQLGD